MAMALSGERSAAKAQVAFMTITRDLCLLHRLHRSISVISRASGVSPLIRLTVPEPLAKIAGNAILRVKDGVAPVR
eukprot:scaffold34313_cov183-Skeletonema_marinoi.AAC.1